MTAPLDDMPHGSGVTDKVGNVAAQLADLYAEIDRATDAYVDHKNDVIRDLAQLPDDQCRALYWRYIKYWSPKEIMTALGCCRKTVYNLFAKGLINLFHLHTKR